MRMPPTMRAASDADTVKGHSLKCHEIGLTGCGRAVVAYKKHAALARCRILLPMQSTTRTSQLGSVPHVLQDLCCCGAVSGNRAENDSMVDELAGAGVNDVDATCAI